MTNQPSSAMIAGIMSGVAAACVCLTVALAVQNRSLQSQLADTRQLHAQAADYTADLRVQQASTTADLASHRQRLAELQQELASLESRVSTNVTVSSRPVPVRIFDGTRLVGVGWIPVSATNQSGLAGEGVATVFLDRRNAAPQAAGGSASAQPAPAASGAVAAVSSAFVVQQSPYYGWFWPYPCWGDDPQPDPEPDEGLLPQPGPVAAPPVRSASPTPVQPTRAQMLSSRQPVFSTPATRTTALPFVPRAPVVSPIQSRVSVPMAAGMRRATPVAANRMASPVIRQPTSVPPVRR